MLGVAFVFLLLGLSFTQAQNYTISFNIHYDCSTGCDWGEPDIWSPPMVPMDGDSVIIDTTDSLFGPQEIYFGGSLKLSLGNLTITYNNTLVFIHDYFILEVANINVTNRATLQIGNGQLAGDNTTVTVSSTVSVDALSSFNILENSMLDVAIGNFFGTFVSSNSTQFTCGVCAFGFMGEVNFPVDQVSQLTIAAFSDIQFPVLMVDTLVLQPSSKVTVTAAFKSTVNTQIGEDAALTVQGTTQFFNLDTADNTPPVSGGGTLILDNIGSAPLDVFFVEASPVYSLFGGELRFSGQVNAEFHTIILQNITFTKNANVRISAYGLQINNSQVIPGSISVFGTNSNATIGLMVANNLELTGCIQVQSGFLSVVNGGITCDGGASPLIANASTILFNSSNINVGLMALGRSNLTAIGTTFSGEFALGDYSSLLIPSTPGLNIQGTFYSSALSNISLPQLEEGNSGTARIRVQGNTTINGNLQYSLASTPPKTVKYVVVSSAANSIFGQFLGEPAPFAGVETPRVKIEYSSSEITLVYERDSEEKKWWIAIVVGVIIFVVAIGGATLIARRRRSDYNPIDTGTV